MPTFCSNLVATQCPQTWAFTKCPPFETSCPAVVTKCVQPGTDCNTLPVLRPLDGTLPVVPLSVSTATFGTTAPPRGL